MRVSLPDYLGLNHILSIRKTEQHFPFPHYCLLPVRHIIVVSKHATHLREVILVIPPQDQGDGFGAEQEDEGPTQVAREICDRTGNGAQVSQALNSAPPFTSPVSAWPGSPPIPRYFSPCR